MATVIEKLPLLELPTGVDLTYMIPLGFYGRISNDPGQTGDGEGRQWYEFIHNIDALPGRPYYVLDRYLDNDLSAYKRDVVRGEFDRLVADLRSGRVRGIGMWKADRLTRKPMELEILIEIYETIPGLVFYSKVEGKIDLSTSTGRTQARFWVMMANQSSADTAERLRSKHAELARNGVAVNARRVFGWKATPESLAILKAAEASGDEDDIAAAKKRVNREQRKFSDPTEAAAIVRDVDQALLGLSRYAIAEKWKKAGFKTVMGNDFNARGVQILFENPRLCGWRYAPGITDENGKRVLVADEKGKPVVGEWDAIISPEKWLALQAKLTDSSQRGISHGRNKYFGSGVFRCERCGRSMAGSAFPYKGEKLHRFICGKTTGGCGTSVIGDYAEAHVEKLLLLKAADQPAEVTAGQPAEEWDRQAALDEAQRLRTEIWNRYVAGDFPADLAVLEVRRLDQEIRALTVERTTWLREHPPLPGIDMDGATMVATWPAMTLQERRAAVLRWIEAVLVSPVGKAQHGFDPARLHVVWRQH